jgi:multidrug efflux pump subunit AcrA (membrane-fusion protein)
VKAQTEFLKTVGELDVERREVTRLTAAARTGAVAQITLLEREYSVEKLESLLSAQKEALRLHGLSERQVKQIETERRLLRELQVVAPVPDTHSEDELRLTIRKISFEQDAPNHARTEEKIPLVLSELNVHKGQAVEAGATLCVLSDMRRLYIEGLAFEQDAAMLEHSVAQGWPVTAVTQSTGDRPARLEGLSLVYIDNRVSYESRALKFYVDLPHVILRTSESADHQRFIDWRFKPGQRMQLRILVEEWPNRIVLPVDAVAQDGAEYFVFMQNGSQFERRAVHVEHKDQFNAVVANDGSLFPGDVVALTGAFELQMALKKRSTPAVHHGHTH